MTPVARYGAYIDVLQTPTKKTTTKNIKKIIQNESEIR